MQIHFALIVIFMHGQSIMYNNKFKGNNRRLLVWKKLNAAGWKTYSGKDANSQSIKNSYQFGGLRFEYNATTSSKTIPLDGGYKMQEAINIQALSR